MKKHSTLCLIILLSGCSDSIFERERINGVFGGVGSSNSDKSSYWSMVINFQDSNASISYPKLSYDSGSCEGKLNYKKQEGNDFYFKENITYGRCASGSVRITKISDDLLEYTFFKENGETSTSNYLDRYTNINEAEKESKSLFEEYKKKITPPKDSSPSSSTDDLLAAATIVGGVIGGIAWLFGAFDNKDDTSTQSGSYEDDIVACNRHYVGERIYIPTGRNNIWGDPIHNSYDIQGIGDSNMTLKDTSNYKVYNLPCSISRFDP